MKSCSELYGDPDEPEEVYKLEKVETRAGIPHQLFFNAVSLNLTSGFIQIVGIKRSNNPDSATPESIVLNRVDQSLNVLTNQSRLAEIVNSYILESVTQVPNLPDGTELGSFEVKLWSSSSPPTYQLVKKFLIPLTSSTPGAYRDKITTYTDLIDLSNKSLITSWQWRPVIDVGQVNLINAITTVRLV